LTNDRTGQFFTPYHVSLMMAKIQVGDGVLPTDHVVKISDPCCGAGGMLVAMSQAMHEKDFNYQQWALFVGQDIDPRCCRMAYIQLSLLACPAVIICGNSLTAPMYEPIHWQRETAFYWMSGIEQKMRMEKAIDAMREIIRNPPVESAPAPIAEPAVVETLPAPPRVLREPVQMELF
jgi:hypothetical protein